MCRSIHFGDGQREINGNFITLLNGNEENKQSNTTCQHCNVRHLCFANAYYSHSRFSICSFHTLCRYKGWQGGAQSGGLALQHLMLYLQLPSGTGEHDEGFNDCFLLCLEIQQYSKPEACKPISNGKCFLYKMHSVFHMLLMYLWFQAGKKMYSEIQGDLALWKTGAYLNWNALHHPRKRQNITTIYYLNPL